MAGLHFAKNFGMNDRAKIFIVSQAEDFLKLLESLLQDEFQCEVRDTFAWTANFNAIKQYKPDLVVLDFTLGPGGNWWLLDRLRADPATSSIPVLAITTLEPLVVESLKSFNVRDVVVKPFDVSSLLESIREILSSPKITVPPVPERPKPAAMGQAADILAGNASEIISSWLRQVNETEPFKSEVKLRPIQLIDETPILLWGTVAALRAGTEAVFQREGDFAKAARNHAVLRMQQGAPLVGLIREYQLLRDAIWDLLAKKAPLDKWSAEDVLAIEKVIRRSLDEAVIMAVETNTHTS